jgi:hypothetical protein
VAQLAQSAEKLAQAADWLTDATTRLSLAAEARHKSLETRGQLTPDLTASPEEFEATDKTDGE